MAAAPFDLGDRVEVQDLQDGNPPLEWQEPCQG
jgi:hypothetical protein